MVVMHGFIFSVHTLKEPQIVTGFVLIVLSRHTVIVLSRHTVIVLSRHAVNALVSRLLYLRKLFDIFHILQSLIMVINNATWKQCNMQYGNHEHRRGTKNTRIFYMGIHNILSVRGIPNILGGCNIS